ncbi:MAG: alpha/beta hydrolase, partial [Oceanobacter sp.]
ADITIAVDLNADTPLPEWFDPQEEDDQRSEDKLGWLTPVLQKAGSLMEMINRNQDTEGDDVGQEVEEKLSKLELISRSLELMQRSLTRFKIAGYPPDLLIKMPMDACEMYEFYRAREMIELGYRITNNVLDGYEKGQNSTYGHRIS